MHCESTLGDQNHLLSCQGCRTLSCCHLKTGQLLFQNSFLNISKQVMSNTVHYVLLSFLLGVCVTAVHADGVKDNHPDQVRPVPPMGVAVEAKDRHRLAEELSKLEHAIEKLQTLPNAPLELLPDVEIFARAVQQGLRHREFFSKTDVENAMRVVREGQQRAEALLAGKAPWTKKTGLVVRGYRSRIDQTVQPYGLVIPKSYREAGNDRYRLDLWFHGRGERSSESVFIAERMSKIGRCQPENTIVLHPYGRYCNAFKFAGEVDVLESLAHAKQQYRVDDNRVAVRGFSMGGAGCWQMAVHYPDMFFAANPGAGFSETPEFLKSFQQETLRPTWYEKKLWQMYDCTGYATNLFQLPTIAYSGEFDIQKQAADIMEQALADEGLRLTHVIGPATKHSIHPDSMQIIESKLAQIAERGRPQLPQEIRFTTYTLKYNRNFWLTLTSLAEHWEPARVTGRILPAENRIALEMDNVTGCQLRIPAGHSPFAADRPVTIVLETTGSSSAEQVTRQTLLTDRPGSDQSWECDLRWDGVQWQQGSLENSGLRKRHGLQGPIDDAFMDSFVIVRPTGKSYSDALANWSESEMNRLVKEWRRHFRGDAVVKRDDEITAADIESSHLILFGDPQSNLILQSLIDRLPVTWTAKQLTLDGKSYDATTHAPVLIYPNPKNPHKYIVLNSGFTYRDYAYLNNARQVPKLPDWAVVDFKTSANSLWPGEIVEANFFDEDWRFK